MSTEYFDFAPSSESAFTFQPTLDGQQYTGIVRWNVFGRRWYLHLQTLSGTRVFCLPLIGSPPGYDISITGGYFTTKLVYRVQNRQIEVID